MSVNQKAIMHGHIPHIYLQIQGSSIKIPVSYFAEIYKIIPKFIWLVKRPRMSKTVSKKSNKFG